MSEHYCVDANVLITAWNVIYPPRIFSPLWELISKQKERLLFIKPVYDEIDPIPSSYRRQHPKSEWQEQYPLRKWLEENEFNVTDVEPEVLTLSLQLERDYQISDHSKGAGQIDVTLIAYAKYHDETVVTLESMQNQPPGKKTNYKIPLICQEQNVKCINFVEMLDNLNLSI